VGQHGVKSADVCAGMMIATSVVCRPQFGLFSTYIHDEALDHHLLHRLIQSGEIRVVIEYPEAILRQGTIPKSWNSG
jgi:hypothetical protein